MDLEARKISFVQEFLRLQNEDIVSGLEKLLHSRKAEILEQQLKPITHQQFNSDIDRSLDDIDNNRIVEAQALKDKFRKWN